MIIGNLMRKYNILPWNNTPRQLYGVRFEEEIFSAFYHINRFPIENVYYSIERIEDRYFFILRFESSKKLQNKEQKQMIMRMEHNKEYYNVFIDKMKNSTKKWKKKKSNDKCTEKDKWMIHFKNEKIKYKDEEISSKEKNVFEIIENFFNFNYFYFESEDRYKLCEREYNKAYHYIKEDKDNDIFNACFIDEYFKEKEINDEDEMMIYFKMRKHKDILKEFIVYSITRNYNMGNPVVVEGYTAKRISELNPHLCAYEIYLLLIRLRDEPESIIKLVEKYDVEPVNNRPQKVYGIKNVSNNFNPEENNPQILYGPPIDINKYLMPKEEKDKLLDIFLKNFVSQKENFLENYIKKDFEDPFWKDVTIKYFAEEIKMNDDEALGIYKELKEYEDIFNEFLACIAYKKYDVKNPISIGEYSAKMIYELNPSLKPHEVYLIMHDLRVVPETTEQIIKEWKN